MSRAFVTIATTLTTAAVAAAVVLAQQPRIVNGRVTAQSAAALPQTFQKAVDAQSDVGWIGYSVPVVDGERTMCCFNSGGTFVSGTFISSDGRTCCGMCGIEPDGLTSTPGQAQTPAGPVKLEGASNMAVLFRVVNKRLDRVRVFSEDCALDAGGRDVVWLTDVRPAESIALLESVVVAQTERRDRITDGAISGIALHRDPAADAALERLVAPGQPPAVRAKVPFWLGNTRGSRGLGVLQRLIKEDASIDVRRKAVVGIAQSHEPRAVDLLIENARTNNDTGVRGESIFWLAQKAGTKAAAAITERIDQDPDTEVKKKAVFALSQLPKTEGVPLLIQVARTNSNPAVRKQAIFWLGQSKDPRALDFFAEILK
jgi:hypothetical protein